MNTILRQLRKPSALVRYGLSSAFTTALSEGILIVLFGLVRMAALSSTVLANVIGIGLSFALSRYWIWPLSDRTHAARQLVAYGAIGIAGLAFSMWAVTEVAEFSFSANAFRVFWVSAAYLGTYGALWLVKFALYDQLLFQSHQPWSSQRLSRSSVARSRDLSAYAAAGDLSFLNR